MTIQEEVAVYAKGNPLAYNAFLDMTRYEMYLIVLGGREWQKTSQN